MAPKGQLFMTWSLGLLALSCLVAEVMTHNFLKDSITSLGFGFDILPPQKTVTVEGARLLIPCRPVRTDKGVANVTWTVGGSVINEPSRYVLPNGTLLIKEVSTADISSDYRCVLRLGTYTVVSHRLNLVLAASGTWQMRPKKAKGREGSPVRLTCHMPSLPTAQLYWYKDLEPLSIESNSRYYQPSPGILQITNITQEDSGIYNCIGVNPLIKNPFTSPNVSVGVESFGHRTRDPAGEVEGPRGGGAPSSPSQVPTLLPVPSKVDVQVGHRAVLECITDDISSPKLLWSRIDGRQIRRNGVRTEGQGSLAFQSVRESDAGVYNCSVFSPLLKSPVTQMIELSVLKPPRVNITIIPAGGQVPNGESIVRINCSATGIPTPEIKWHKDGQAVPFLGRHIFDIIEKDRNFTLEQLAVTNIMAADTGVFQCIAKNLVGVASEGVLLKVNLSPNMPGVAQNLTVNEKTSTSILLTWDPPPPPAVPNGLHLEFGYVIHYLEISGSDQEKQQVTNSTSSRISELRPFTYYSIYVRTFTIEQDQAYPLFGEPTKFLVEQTMSDVPTMLPEVELTPLSPTVLRVQWKLLMKEQARGLVTHQKVQWRKIGAEDARFVEVSPEDNVYDIKGLHPNKWYEARVLARTPAGYPDVQYLAWQRVKMPKRGDSDKRPTLHLSVSSDNPTQILANWELDENLRAQVFSYSVSCNNSRGSESHRNLHASASSIILDDLEAGTCYSVCVVPMYKRGRETGKTSVTQTICTLAPMPPHRPPTDSNAKIGVKKVKVKKLSTTSIQVTWRPKGRSVAPEFFTVKVVHLGRQVYQEKDSHGHKDAYGGNPQPLKESQPAVDDPEEEEEEEEEETAKQQEEEEEEEEEVGDQDPEVRYWRVTGRKVVLNNLKPLSQYEISVSASTLAVSSAPSKPVLVTTTEGVPTAPLNVSWKAATPKDVDLVWSRPEHINGHLLYYLVTYSRDLLEWKNHTVDSHLTSTQIQDLVSNTNYTIQISGVTGGGRGTLTTIFVYINATLVGEPHISTELVVISVVTSLAAITFLVVVFLCLRVIRLRQSAATSAFQGNGTCRMIYANGLKPTSRDCTELNDYKPMLTSLPAAVQNPHLDTKGGPGSHGVGMDCLLDENASSLNQADVPNENHVPLRDGIGPNSLDDIDDDDDDASSKLLQPFSDGCSPLPADFDSRCMGESTQVEPGSSSDSTGVVEITASS